MLQQVAQGLGDLREEMVFIGGAVTELYADDERVEFIVDKMNTIKFL